MEEKSAGYRNMRLVKDAAPGLKKIYTLAADRFNDIALLEIIDAAEIVRYYNITSEWELFPLYDAIKEGSALEIKEWSISTIYCYEFVGGHGT